MFAVVQLVHSEHETLDLVGTVGIDVAESDAVDIVVVSLNRCVNDRSDLIGKAVAAVVDVVAIVAVLAVDTDVSEIHLGYRVPYLFETVELHAADIAQPFAVDVVVVASKNHSQTVSLH